jgi:putative phosphoribosyl transferase
MESQGRVVFDDRAEAGRLLGKRLEHVRGRDLVVLGLPRGGVVVAFEVARELRAPLDVIVVRKVGVPFQPELAMGAVGEGGALVLNHELVGRLGVSDRYVLLAESRARAELEARVRRLRQGRDPLDLRGRTAVIVDDGIATGSTAQVACEVARHLGARHVVMAAPVGPPAVQHGFAGADEVVLVETPEPFVAVGRHYRDFAAVTDEEVAALLAEAPRLHRENPTPG